MRLTGRWSGDTLALRLTLFLAIGATIAAAGSLTLAEAFRQHQMRIYRTERVAMSVAGLLDSLAREPGRTTDQLDRGLVQGGRLLLDARAPVRELDDAMTARLARLAGPGGRIRVFRTDPSICIGHPERRYVRRTEGYIGVDPECWVVAVDRTPRMRNPVILGIDLAPLPRPNTMGLSPGFLLIVTGMAVVLSFLVARTTLGFMRRLTRAAQAFASDIDAAPVRETGPRDVRETFAAFNLMQRRIREGIAERAQILAAISHDLQTPLTRLLLRLELVTDARLRQRLVADVAAMQRLVGEGLVLARSGESSDDWTVLDAESLLASMVEDAADAGVGPVTLGRVEPLELRVKPDALQRCLQNLVDNALRYGGAALLECFARDGQGHVVVRDSGPGIAEHLLEDMFKPFVRGEASRSRQTGGTGIGLTIARAQAATFGGAVSLANAPEGGLVATVTIPLSVVTG